MSTVVSNVNKLASPSAALHTNCAKAPAGNALSDSCHICLLPSNARKITIEYLDDRQKDEAIVTCSLMAHHIFPGWDPEECTDDKIRNLFVASMTDLVTQASKRREIIAQTQPGTGQEAQAAAFEALNEGFWYPNDYFMALKKLQQEARLKHYKNKNAFYHGLAPAGFTHVEDPHTSSGMRVSGYLLKRLSAAQGVVSIQRSLCFIDCQELVETAFCRTLLQVWGGERFNDHFRPNGPNALRLDPNIGLTPLLPLLSKRNTEKGKLGKRPVQRGEALFFGNIPLYAVKHPEGEAGGFHAVCMQKAPSQKYLAFGLSPKGVTEETIIDTFVECFNEPPLRATEMYSEDLAKRISINMFRETYVTNAPPGTSRKEVIREANKFKLTRAQYLEAVMLAPEVGYKASEVVSLDSAKILEKLQERDAEVGKGESNG